MKTLFSWIVQACFLIQSHAFEQSKPKHPISPVVRLDIPRLQKDIDAGRVHQHFGFLSEEQVKEVLKEVKQLEKDGEFARSGLSNTAASDQGFGQKDRSVCEVPWWKSSQQGIPIYAPTINSWNLAQELQMLRLKMAGALDRPSMCDPDLAHECYYSISRKGSFLPRHMDERHEELKGAKGWLLPSRRSLSWLIYLSDADWNLVTNGGALRAFAPAEAQQPSQHDGNLQVGWLWSSPSEPQAVYLNSWYKEDDFDDPSCVLYTIDGERNNVMITKPWSSPSLGTVGEFLTVMAEVEGSSEDESTIFLSPEVAEQFSLLEERNKWDEGENPRDCIIQDVTPTRGSLVIFDSVRVPHQVQEVHEGKRIALAGWFHEATQAMPDDLG